MSRHDRGPLSRSAHQTTSVHNRQTLGICAHADFKHFAPVPGRRFLGNPAIMMVGEIVSE